VKAYFIINNINEAERKRAALITSFGTIAHTALRNLVAPTTPLEVDYDDIVKKLSDYYMEPTNPMVERCHFYDRSRKKGETVSAFLAELRALADKCDFGTNLQTMLRDRLVCGINDDKMQRRLLSEPHKDLTLHKASELCLAMETADKNVADALVD
jgi:hypothetical protein